MKVLRFSVMIFLLAAFIYSCSDDGVSSNNNVSDMDAYKQIVVQILNSETQGFSAVINGYFTDDKSREDFMMDYLQYVRYFADSSGYVYAYDTNYICITNPVLPDYKGKNHYDDQDSKGTYIFHEMKKVLDADGAGFVYYYFNNPTTSTDESKTSYVQLIPDTKYWLGAGIYLERIPKLNLTQYDLNKLVIQNCVHTTATGFATMFAKTIKTGNERENFIRKYNDSTRFLSDGSGYFFVDDMSGYSISYPTRKDLESTDLTSIQDANGVYPVVEMLKVLNSDGHGFVKYQLQNPATNTLQNKTVYVEKIAGTNYFIGCGFYEE